MRRAIVIGASSGIGKELAAVLSQDGFVVGLMARRIDLLEELRRNLPNPAFSRQADISDHSSAMAILENLIEEMGGVDLVIVSSGTGKAIQRKAKHAYVTKRWSVIGWLLKVLPDFLYGKL